MKYIKALIAMGIIFILTVIFGNWLSTLFGDFMAIVSIISGITVGVIVWRRIVRNADAIKSN